MFADLADVGAKWTAAARFTPDMHDQERQEKLARWHKALELALV
jgi:glycerol kinase